MRFKAGQRVTDGLLTGVVLTPKCSIDGEVRTIIRMERTGREMDLDTFSLTLLGEVDDWENLPITTADDYVWNNNELVILDGA